MLKMKRNFATTAGALAILISLVLVLGIVATILTQYIYSRPPISTVIASLLPIVYFGLCFLLMTVCCFRRKLGIFSGIVMGLVALYYLWSLVQNIIGLIGGTTTSPLLTSFYALCHLISAGLFVLLLLTCVTDGRKKFSFVPAGTVAVTVLNAVLVVVDLLPQGADFSALSGADLFLFIFVTVFSSIPHLISLFMALAINGAQPDRDPMDQTPLYLQYQAPQYQVPQYQVPQYRPAQAPQPHDPSQQ